MTSPTTTNLPKIDRGCFERAILYKAAPLVEPGCYEVRSVEDPLKDPHYVDLHSSDVPRCDCPDFLYRERLCKHILSALLYENHPAAQEELAQFILARRQSCHSSA